MVVAANRLIIPHWAGTLSTAERNSRYHPPYRQVGQIGTTHHSHSPYGMLA
jgi:hypothetical protein